MLRPIGAENKAQGLPELEESANSPQPQRSVHEVAKKVNTNLTPSDFPKQPAIYPSQHSSKSVHSATATSPLSTVMSQQGRSAAPSDLTTLLSKWQQAGPAFQEFYMECSIEEGYDFFTSRKEAFERLCEIAQRLHHQHIIIHILLSSNTRGLFNLGNIPHLVLNSEMALFKGALKEVGEIVDTQGECSFTIIPRKKTVTQDDGCIVREYHNGVIERLIQSSASWGTWSGERLYPNGRKEVGRFDKFRLVEGHSVEEDGEIIPLEKGFHNPLHHPFQSFSVKFDKNTYYITCKTEMHERAEQISRRVLREGTGMLIQLGSGKVRPPHTLEEEQFISALNGVTVTRMTNKCFIEIASKKQQSILGGIYPDSKSNRR